MNAPARTGSGRGRRRSPRLRSIQTLPQLPWRQVTNPYPPMQLASEEQLQAIHNTSMRILRELGIELVNDRALKLFAEAGAEVDWPAKTVRIDEALVNKALATAPASVTITPRNPDKTIIVGGNHLNFSLVAGPPNVHDAVNGRRSGNYQDYCDFVRLAQHFNAIHLLGNQVVAPIEMPANNRHLDTYNANLTYSDLSFMASAIGRGRTLDAISMMGITKGLSLEEMRNNPALMTIISINSPRKIDDAMADGLMAMAEYGQVNVITPFTLMGAMTPVSLPAALAQQNAEALFGITLTQLVNPGVPVVYGAYTSNVDMRSGAPAFGTPENTKANIISGQLARRYNLPYRCSPTNASNAADGQSVYETEMALWSCILGHGNIIYHAAGWLEGGLTASFEKFILDVEMIQHLIEFLRPIEFNEAELGFDAIKNVPTGGHFFGEAHTLERYETAFYEPLVSNWQNYENWQAGGGKTADERATDLWQEALKAYELPPMPADRREALDAYIAKRKEAIGTGEP